MWREKAFLGRVYEKDKFSMVAAFQFEADDCEGWNGEKDSLILNPSVCLSRSFGIYVSMLSLCSTMFLLSEILTIFEMTRNNIKAHLFSSY